MVRSNRELRQFAAKLRRNQTEAEKALWGLWFLGFRPQAITPCRYIADYYNPYWRVIVEADGGIHEVRRGYDSDRDKRHYKKGVYTIRFSNDTILNHLFYTYCAIVYLSLCWAVWRVVRYPFKRRKR